MHRTWEDTSMLASATFDRAPGLCDVTPPIANWQNNRCDKRGRARMFFFILRGGATCAPICMAAIYFCQYPWCDYDRNRRAATRSDVRAAK
jgi:hypothetical protein